MTGVGCRISVQSGLPVHGSGPSQLLGGEKS